MSATSSLQAERDLYAALLDLAEHDDPDTFLGAACELLRTSADAEMVFLGIYREHVLIWQCARGLNPTGTGDVLRHLSTGVLAKARTGGQLVQLPSAMLDPDFASRKSVRRNQIEAVLCAPFDLENGLQGVLYLQRHRPGGAFPPAAVDVLQRILRHLPRLGPPQLAHGDDPTAPLRTALKAEAVVGRSQALAEVLRQLQAAAVFEVDTLLTGPTGTGKSLFARVVHENSPRARRSFVVVNCAAVAPQLFESSFFGVKAGAYTGAHTDRPGFFAEAEGGTLFLDEVGELDTAHQTKLLQVLQERTYQRVGGTRTHRANVRLVAATNRDLPRMVDDGTFRSDLWFRLSKLRIHIPGLAVRTDDIRPLALHFVAKALTTHKRLEVAGLSPAALIALVHAPWPGNVRQLQHTVESGLMRAQLRGATVAEVQDVLPDASRDAEELTWQAATRRFQRDLLARTLKQHNGSVAAAAKALDIARSHAYDLVRSLGLKRTP